MEDSAIYFTVNGLNYPQLLEWLEKYVGRAGVDYDWISIRLATRGVRVYDARKRTLTRLVWG